MTASNARILGFDEPTHDGDPLSEAAKALRLEALLARQSSRGRHPRIATGTHAAALNYAADLLDQFATGKDADA